MPKAKAIIKDASAKKNYNKSNLIRIAKNTGTGIEEGQKVLVCRKAPGEIISQRTGKRMGFRERVIASGTITKVNGEAFVMTEKPVLITGAIEVKSARRQRLLFASPQKNKTPAIYAKIVEE